MRATDITLEVFEKYKPEELAGVAKQMAQAQGDLETVEIEKKLSDGAFNERIKQHGATVSDLAKKYNKGGESAQIGCTIRYDIPEVGKKSYIRMDTEETVEVHDMDFSERQETIQFPLTAASEPKADEPQPEISEEPATGPTTGESREEFERDRFGTAGPIQAEPKPPEVSFKDIKAIAAHIAKSQLDPEKHAAAIANAQKGIATRLLINGKVIGPDGRLEDVQSAETADTLAAAWLALAIDELTKPAEKEEVTKLCPYPGCILFAWHEGKHDIPTVGPKGSEPAPETQLQPEPKKTRKKRAFAPPPDAPTQPGAPTA